MGRQGITSRILADAARGARVVLRLPEVNDPRSAATARLLVRLGLTLVSLTALFFAIAVPFAPYAAARWVTLLLAFAVVGGLTALLARRGRVKTAAYFILLAVWLVTTLLAWSGAGLRSPSLLALLVFVALASLLLDWRGSLTAVLMALATTFLLAWAQVSDVLPPPVLHHTPWSYALTAALCIILAGALTALGSVNLRRARDDTVRALDELRRADEVLRESETRYRLVADFTHDWEAWRGPDGRYLYVSPAAERLTGHAASEFLADPDLLLRIVHPDDRGTLSAHLVASAAPGRPDGHHEFRILTPAGDTRWIGHVCTDVFDDAGRWAGRRESNRDVTGEVRAREAIRQSEARYRAVADTAADAIVTADRAGTITGWNAAAEHIFGYPAEEAVGMHATEILPERDRGTYPALVKRLQDGDASQAAGRVAEMTGLRRSGEEFPMELSVAGWRVDGQTFTTTIIRDVTRRHAAERAVRARTRELDALLGVSRAIAGRLDDDSLPAEIARAAGQALGSDRCVIWACGPRDRRAVFSSIWEREPAPGVAERLAGAWHDLAAFHGGVEALGTASVFEELISDPALPPEDRRRMARAGETSALVVPLVSEHGLLGVMLLTECERERTFTGEEMRLARGIGEQAAVALDNARLYREQEQRNRWLDALAQASRQITHELDMDRLLDNVARFAAESVGSPVAIIEEYDAESDAFVSRSRVGPEGAGRAEHLAAVDRGRADHRALLGAEVVVWTLADTGLDPGLRDEMLAAGEKTVVGVPFHFAGRPLGVLLLVETERERTFGDDELAFLHALARQAAVAMNNAYLYATIEAQAATDGLTGLANHRTFVTRLDEEVTRVLRFGTSVSLLLLDIDDFKTLNDAHGHLAGDEALRHLARLVAAEVRGGVDLPARYGGEEFAVIMPETTCAPGPGGGAAPGGAAAVAERLRARVAAEPFIAEGSKRLALTVSIGVACLPLMASDARGLIACADAALYDAKAAGKDCVRVCRA